MSEIPPGAITLGDLYRVMSEMHQDVTKALERLAVIDQRNQTADDIHRDHEGRLRVIEAALPDNASQRMVALEAFKWKFTGAVLAINGLAVLGEWILFVHK